LKYVDPTGHKEDGECGLNGEDCGEQSPPIDEVIEAYLNAMHDMIYDPERTDPILVPLPNGLTLVIMPVDYPSSIEVSEDRWTQGTILAYAGQWMDIFELAAIFIPDEGIFGDIALSIGDEVVSYMACADVGLCYKGKPHPNLPEMHVFGQDVLVTTIDLLAPPVSGATAGALTANPAVGIGTELVVDVATTSFSLFYDSNRLAEEWTNQISVGIGDNRGWILYYPTSE
jgi:hypothetical protein